MVKRKRNGTGRRSSQRAGKTKQVEKVRDDAQIASENVETEPVQPDTAALSHTSDEQGRNPERDDAPQSASIEFKHESILRVDSRSGMSAPSSDDDEVGDSDERVAFGANEGSDGSVQHPNSHMKDTGAERKHFTVLRSGEVFGTHYSVVRVDMPGMQLSGAAWLSVLDGTVEVFGAMLDSDDAPVLVSSAPLSSFILTLTPQGRVMKADRRARRDNATHPEAVVHSKIRKAVSGGLRKLSGKRCIVLLTSVPTGSEDLLSSDHQQNNTDVFSSASVYPSLGSLPGILPGTMLLPTASVPLGSSKYLVFQEWQNLAVLLRDLDTFLSDESDDKSLRVLVCGAGGTGKSTLTRYLVNHLLLHKTRVVLIDTDVGQPDMNPPGLVGAHIVSDFRIGAPTASTRNVPLSARFLGETTPREEPDLYERFAKQVIEDAITFAEANNYATVINSDGWISGVGADLLHHIADSSKPTHIVQLKFSGHAEKQSLTDVCARVDSNRAYLFTSPGPTLNVSITSSGYRDSQIASYFCKEMTLGRVYQVSLDDLQVSSVEDGSWDGSIPQLVNGSVVALGKTRNPGREGKGDCDVKGLGVVRGVDPGRRILFLCSPVPLDILAKCDKMIQSGGIQLPHSFITSAVAVEKSPMIASPYVLSGGIVSGNVMRSRKTLNRR